MSPRRPLRKSLIGVLVVSALLSGAVDRRGLPAYRPSAEQLLQSYQRANDLRREYESRAFKLRLTPRWLESGKRFWYRNDLRGRTNEFILVDAEKGRRSAAFDHARLAKALSEKLGRPVESDRLPFDAIHFPDSNTLRFRVDAADYDCSLDRYELRPGGPMPEPPPDNPRPRSGGRGVGGASAASADGKWTARVFEHNVYVKPAGGDEFKLTENGSPAAYFDRVQWTPDSSRIVAHRVTPGDRGVVYLVESSPREGNRAKLHTRVYDQPGDKLDSTELWLLDPVSKASAPIDAPATDFWNAPRPRWKRDGKRFTYEKLDRGYQRWRLIEVDPSTGKTRALIDERSPTFIDSTSQYIYYCTQSDELIYRSEKDGWGHLYLNDGDGGSLRPITKGSWVVRSILDVDEKARRILFAASGMNPAEDPYFLHYYSVSFDGTGLTPLTPGAGNHTVSLAPDKKTLVDTFSTAVTPPVHELRRVSDGKLLCALETADIADLLAYGWEAPEIFAAKGRDGWTDIWGIAYRPSNFDPSKSYPVIEDIYAGPQDSFVPKSFSVYNGMMALSELGFVVVKMDGMGTRNRSKAFHDVTWKNLGDHGFPDRMTWIRALGARHPQLDLSRVGIYGTSAGGQSSTAALLFHPGFYKVAVSSCGCHDNRIDKVWWNEQWMGYPLGPHYAEQSNITQAGKLVGRLLLIVGEMDRNVPPESTYRLADALIKAQKDFDLILLPGVDHTSGGTYGERRRRDYFVRHLLGVEPPDWNGLAERGSGR